MPKKHNWFFYHYIESHMMGATMDSFIMERLKVTKNVSQPFVNIEVITNYQNVQPSGRIWTRKKRLAFCELNPAELEGLINALMKVQQEIMNDVDTPKKLLDNNDGSSLMTHAYGRMTPEIKRAIERHKAIRKSKQREVIEEPEEFQLTPESEEEKL